MGRVVKWTISEELYLILWSKGGDDDITLVKLNGTNGIAKWQPMNMYRALVK